MTALNKQALREAAEKAIGAHERLSIMPSDDIFDISLHEGTQLDADITDLNAFNEATNPATVLALLDELEAKDKSIGFLKDQLAQLANFNPDWDRLEAAIDSLREHMAKLSAAEKRIAELEARTVCLPKLPVLGSNAEWYEGFAAGASGMRNECADAIRAAGIGVKGE
ncbi:ead/Ea22-like family protein [Citrobacter freundii]|nr:ead/Ea22-like family protein [Citrobacter freundii]